MKKFTRLLSVVLLLALWACGSDRVGPAGPQGPQGPSGPQGEQGESGFVIEFENINFTGPEYEIFLGYGDFEVLPSDVVLVYLLWDVQTIDGEEVEVWRQLPQTIFHPNGLLVYNFDFAVTDARLFLSGDFDLDLLTAVDTDNWVARIVVVPGDFVNTGGRKDFSDYNKVKELLGLPELEAKERGVIRRVF